MLVVIGSRGWIDCYRRYVHERTLRDTYHKVARSIDFDLLYLIGQQFSLP